MNMPGFDAESSLDPTIGIYRGNAVFGRSGTGEVLPIFVHALTTGLVSFRKPDGLILSTGNLYFTSHDASTASVWRTAQSSSPGQEILLYCEPGATFGDIVYAQVDGIWWGYFFATAGVVTIKRVPLTGGAATVLATLTNIDAVNSHRNLVTDGVNRTSIPCGRCQSVAVPSPCSTRTHLPQASLCRTATSSTPPWPTFATCRRAVPSPLR